MRPYIDVGSGEASFDQGLGLVCDGVRLDEDKGRILAHLGWGLGKVRKAHVLEIEPATIKKKQGKPFRFAGNVRT